jgi:hypothetical protein
VVSSLQVFRLKFCTHFSSLPWPVHTIRWRVQITNSSLQTVWNGIICVKMSYHFDLSNWGAWGNLLAMRPCACVHIRPVMCQTRMHLTLCAIMAAYWLSCLRQATVKMYQASSSPYCSGKGCNSGRIYPSYTDITPIHNSVVSSNPLTQTPFNFPAPSSHPSSRVRMGGRSRLAVQHSCSVYVPRFVSCCVHIETAMNKESYVEG